MQLHRARLLSGSPNAARSLWVATLCCSSRIAISTRTINISTPFSLLFYDARYVRKHAHCGQPALPCGAQHPLAVPHRTGGFWFIISHVVAGPANNLISSYRIRRVYVAPPWAVFPCQYLHCWNTRSVGANNGAGIISPGAFQDVSFDISTLLVVEQNSCVGSDQK